MRRVLNPVVFELARLLAIVSTFICCAVIPLPALYNARIILVFPLLLSSRYSCLPAFLALCMMPTAELAHFCNVLNRAAIHVQAYRQRLLERFKLPHDTHQADRAFGRLAVGAFELSLPHRRARGLRRCLTGEISGAAFRQDPRLLKRNDGQLSYVRATLAYHALHIYLDRL